MSNYLENELLDHVFNNATAPAVTNVYVKLHVGDPGEDCTGNAATETDRIEATFGNAASGAVANDADIEWTGLAATETISHISLWDHATAGNPLVYGALTTPQDVNAGGDFTIATGDLDITFA
jgi:hypothetical protein